MNFYTSQFSRTHRIRSVVSRMAIFSYTSRRGLTRGLRRRGGLGFLPSSKLSREEAFLLSLDLKGKTVYDVGGFIGLMTIFFASRAERVITYEPLQDSQLRIIQNVDANGYKNVLLRKVALSSSAGDIEIVYNKLMSGAATGDPEISAAMAGSAPSFVTCTVPATTLDEEVASGIPAPNFVKVDVEGMELLVLQGMRAIIQNQKPSLYIELHGTTPSDKKENAEGTINFLRSEGYEIYDIEKLHNIGLEDPISGKESHIFCK